jgi:hypothetical protein
MTVWTRDDLAKIDGAQELRIAPSRTDGTLRPYTTIWVVRVGDDIYVRSFRGHQGRWFQRAQRSRQGRIRAGGIERDVTFEDEQDAHRHQAIDDAYRAKYGRYGDAYIRPMLGPDAVSTTFRLVPR